MEGQEGKAKHANAEGVALAPTTRRDTVTCISSGVFRHEKLRVRIYEEPSYLSPARACNLKILL